jgi:hypothetical protein
VTAANELRSVRIESLPRSQWAVNEPAPNVGVGTTTQQLIVPVLPGPLTISPATVTVSMRRNGNGNHYTGAIPTITVVDARGTLAGWRATVTLVSATGVHAPRIDARLFPDRPVVVYGDAFGVGRAHPGALDDGSAQLLCSAMREHGGGTYSCGGRIDANRRDRTVDAFTITLALAVA